MLQNLTGIQEDSKTPIRNQIKPFNEHEFQTDANATTKHVLESENTDKIPWSEIWNIMTPGINIMKFVRV